MVGRAFLPSLRKPLLRSPKGTVAVQRNAALCLTGSLCQRGLLGQRLSIGNPVLTRHKNNEEDKVDLGRLLRLLDHFRFNGLEK